MSIPTNEQETVINFSRSDETAVVYTSDATVMTKLDKKVKNHPNTWSVIEEIKDMNHQLVAKKYKVNKKMISFRNEKTTRPSNPNAGEALKRWREEKKNQGEGL